MVHVLLFPSNLEFHFFIVDLIGARGIMESDEPGPLFSQGSIQVLDEDLVTVNVHWPFFPKACLIPDPCMVIIARIEHCRYFRDRRR